MLRRIEIEAINLDEATKKAVAILKLAPEKIFISEIETTETGIVAEALVDVNLALEGRRYLEGILNQLNITYQIEARTLNNESEYRFIVNSDENPLLIGKDGRTLDALQLLLRTYISSFSSERISVTLDIGGYHAKRIQTLEVLATKTAKEVSKTRIPAKLKPMNAFERRIIHAKLSDWRDVYTESEGDGEDRAVVIYPKKREN